MQDVIKTNLAAFAVFEPLLAGLVAAYIKLPGYRRPIIKILGSLINPFFSRVLAQASACDILIFKNKINNLKMIMS
jgi:hypothetical protein